MSTAVESRPVDPSNPEASAVERARLDDARRRYLSAFDELLMQSTNDRTLGVFADALSWTAARLIDAYGTPAAGDLLRRTGSYIGELAERQRAVEEAAEAIRAGRQPS